ncbi:MAG: sigma-54-dependent Fis family transcriptional regulator [Gemmatimonadetes bacterium]|jgi:DNA-binding NtrC family response regulator|nr:sigma-54-dependent Fis family transcriptional regulator [Gemmatimonadota bacterium]
MAVKPRILIVDDEKVVRESLYEWFTEDGYQVDTADSGRQALERLQESTCDILLVDIKMPGMDGLELQRKVQQIAPEAVIIIMTAYASVDTAVQALKAGAYDYITKPFDPDDLERIVNKAAERQQLVRENVLLKEQLVAVSEGDGELIGTSSGIEKVREMIQHVGDTDTTVLITGESGTGKELVARAIHRASTRRHMPLVTVNCAGLPEGLIESELFGHEKGAFTGAQYRRKGKFELADGGSIFFDEIGDISPKTQVDLLRVLEEKMITRVGGTQILPVDFRVIAATHRNLKQAVEQNLFRLDLFYRLNVFTISIPPLRERRSDIPLLARHFLTKSAREMGRPTSRISPAAMQLLSDYAWPGNVRELENAIERAVVLQREEEIQLEDLPMTPSAAPLLAPAGELSLEEMERHHIQQVLDQMSGNVSKAARTLGIDRVTLYNKIRKYDLKRNQNQQD